MSQRFNYVGQISDNTKQYVISHQILQQKRRHTLNKFSQNITVLSFKATSLVRSNDQRICIIYKLQ